MTTFDQLVLDAMSLKRGQMSDDDIGDKRQYEFWINNTRALLIRQDYAKNRTLSENVIQDLGCVEIETADVSECCDMTYGCSIKRTKLLLPKPVELLQNDAIMRVATIDKTSKAFSIVSYDQFIFSGNGRFNTNQIYATFRNSRIFLKSNSNTLTLKAMKYINIRGIFEDPREAKKFTRCNGTPCYTNNSDYPISNWMIEIIKKMILDTDIKIMFTLPSDPSNDSSGQDIIQQQQK